MPPQLALDVLYCVASSLVGGTITWRLLGRSRRGRYRKLAQELTDGVHDRCSAYQKLEDRIDTVIAGFDQRETEIHEGLEDVIPPVHPAEVPASADGDALSWMDTCDGPGDPISAEVGETAFVGLPVADPRSVDDTQTVVDRFAQSLQVLQKEKSDELERQRGWIGSLEGRIQTLEACLQELAQRERGPRSVDAGSREPDSREPVSREPGSRDSVSRESAARAERAAPAPIAEMPAWEQSLQKVYDRIARSEHELAAWHAHHEGLARERLATIESAREISAQLGASLQRNPEAEASAMSARARAEELARDIAKLEATITRREKLPSGPILAAPRILAAMEARSKTNAPAPRPAADRERAGPAREAQPNANQGTSGAARAPGSTARPATGLDDLPGLADTTKLKPRSAGEALLGSPSEISQLMKNLEIARGEAETYRRRLHEQNTQFTAAYAMLDRIRPLVETLEDEFAARSAEGERPS